MRNVGRRVQMKWNERENSELSSDVSHSWVREKGVGHVGPFTKEKTADETLDSKKARLR